MNPCGSRQARGRSARQARGRPQLGTPHRWHRLDPYIQPAGVAALLIAVVSPLWMLRRRMPGE